MKSNKISTVFLILLMIFTLTISVGCGKENEEKPNNENQNQEIAEKEEEKKEEEEPAKPATKKIKLLKRNGVEWKENTRINSKVGAKKYTVVWGDTLSLIARTWKVNCYTLAKYNNIKNIDLIEVGQVIYNYKSNK